MKTNHDSVIGIVKCQNIESIQHLCVLDGLAMSTILHLIR